MTARVITVTAQVGSGGFTIANSVAEALGYRYYDWEITSEAAARAGVTPQEVAAAERVPGFVERMMRRLVTASAVSGEETIFIEPAPTMVGSAVQSLNSDEYRQFIERVVAELAERGDAVIVGHAAQATLHRPDVLKVLIHGSAEQRAQRLAAEQSSTVEAATEVLRQSDRDRRELFRHAYKIDWLDAGVYELCINTDRLASDLAVKTIIAAARAID